MPAEPQPGVSPAALEQHREALYRYALLHLRVPDDAEDAVQETFLAALQGAAAFRGESALRTWLIGILKRKIVDRIRRQVREPVVQAPVDPETGEEDAAFMDRLFQADGHWTTPPQAWADPQGCFENEAFWRVFETCVRELPGKAARVFLLREVAGLEAAEICKDVGISASNYWVIMHRARLRLRDCLDACWFQKSSGGS